MAQNGEKGDEVSHKMAQNSKIESLGVWLVDMAEIGKD